MSAGAAAGGPPPDPDGVGQAGAVEAADVVVPALVGRVDEGGDGAVAEEAELGLQVRGLAPHLDHRVSLGVHGGADGERVARRQAVQEALGGAEAEGVGCGRAIAVPAGGQAAQEGKRAARAGVGGVLAVVGHGILPCW